jgi:uncharacterized membrane protein
MRKFTILFVAVLCLLPPLSAQGGANYQVRDLGVLPGFVASSAVKSNWIGQVTGSNRNPDPACHAFLWNALTGMRDLGTIGTQCATGLYVDALGRVGGLLSHTSPSFGYRSFFWSLSSGMIDIGSLAEENDDATVVQAMNNRGEIVGFSQEGQYCLGCYPPERAFYWSRTTGIRSLAGLSDGRSWATAINDSGHIVGMSSVSVEMGGGPHTVYWPGHSSPIVDLAATLGIPGGSRAFQINNRNQIVGDRLVEGTRRIGMFIANPATGPVVEIGDFGFISSGTRDMNDAGQVAGTVNLGPSFAEQDNRGFRWTPPGTGPAVMEQIQPLPGHTQTAGNSINSRGQVVGASFLREAEQARGIFWTPATGTVALPSLVPGDSCQALDINDFGLISGWCYGSDGMAHAVVWARGLIGLPLFP